MKISEYKQMMAYLTRSGIKDKVKFASDIARPEPKPIVKEIELFNKFNKRNPRAGGGRIGFKKAAYVKMTPEERAAAYAKRDEKGVASKLIKEQKFKDVVDKIFETEDFENFKSQPTKAQLRFAKKASKVREGTGIVPAQYITQFNKAIAAGVDSQEFKDILRITGRSTEDILKLNRLRPGGTVPIKVRAEAAAKSFPEDRKKTELQKKESAKKVQVKRAGLEKKAKEFASETDLQDIKLIDQGKKNINKFFKNNPDAINNTAFGRNIKNMMAIRVGQDGNFYSRLMPDDYYLKKAKDYF